MALKACGMNATLCACRDFGMTKMYLRKSSLDRKLRIDNYFNTGFMVIRPSLELYYNLTEKLQHDKAKITNYVFGEQDFLNTYFREKWKVLSPTLNVMHITSVRDNMIAIHEKLWTLQKNFKGPNYLWNRDKNIPHVYESTKNHREKVIGANITIFSAHRARIVSNHTMSLKKQLRRNITIAQINDTSTLDMRNTSLLPRHNSTGDKRKQKSWQFEEDYPFKDFVESSSGHETLTISAPAFSKR